MQQPQNYKALPATHSKSIRTLEYYGQENADAVKQTTEQRQMMKDCF